MWKRTLIKLQDLCACGGKEKYMADRKVLLEKLSKEFNLETGSNTTPENVIKAIRVWK